MTANRQQFHQQHAQQARAQALRLYAEREQRGVSWLNWVAHELYQLKPAPFANMVRRELEKLNQ